MKMTKLDLEYKYEFNVHGVANYKTNISCSSYYRFIEYTFSADLSAPVKQIRCPIYDFLLHDKPLCEQPLLFKNVPDLEYKMLYKIINFKRA